MRIKKECAHQLFGLESQHVNFAPEKSNKILSKSVQIKSKVKKNSLCIGVRRISIGGSTGAPVGEAYHL